VAAKQQLQVLHAQIAEAEAAVAQGTGRFTNGAKEKQITPHVSVLDRSKREGGTSERADRAGLTPTPQGNAMIQNLAAVRDHYQAAIACRLSAAQGCPRHRTKRRRRTRRGAQI
jgi:hypothetical protein